MIDDDDLHAVCVICGTELELVRPGKHQHPGDTERLCSEIERLVAERKEWNATITAERERMDRLVEQIAAERDALLKDVEVWRGLWIEHALREQEEKP